MPRSRRGDRLRRRDRRLRPRGDRRPAPPRPAGRVRRGRRAGARRGADGGLPRAVARRRRPVHDERARRCGRALSRSMETPPLVATRARARRGARLREVVPAGGRRSPARARGPPRDHPRGGDRNGRRRRCGLDRLGPAAAGAVLHAPSSTPSSRPARRSSSPTTRTSRSLAGPWRATLPPEAPFDLLFVDARDAKDDVDAVVGLLAPGGTAVLDDFWFDPALPDPRRDAWLAAPAAGDGRALGDTGAARPRLRAPVAPSGSGYPCR